MTTSNGLVAISVLGMEIGIIDLIVVLYILIMALIGIKRGFVKMLFKLCGTLAIIIGAVLLARPFGEALVSPIGHFIENPITEWMAGLTTESGIQIFTQSFNWGDPAVQNELLPMALSAMGLPSFLSGIIVDLGIFSSMLEGVGEVALIDVLPAGITAIAMTVIAFVILLIVLAILVYVIKRLLTNLTEFSLFGGINKILGFIFGLVQAYLVVSVILAVVSYIPAPGILETIQAQIEASYVVKLLAENNWIGNWLITTILP